MSEWDYSWDYGGAAPYDDWSWASTPDYMSGDAYQQFTGWGDPTGPGSSGDTGFSGEGSGGWLSSVLGSLGGLSGVIGPALSAGGALAGGAIGSNAASDASRLQADALNRGIDLQTAQWLQQQGNLAPYLQAGQGGLAQLQQLAGREAPALPGATPGIRSADYNASLPDLMPGWRPQAYQGPQSPDAGAYRWNPQQGPQAQDYRYTPGAVPTLSGQELLANDPGYQFRMDESRKALEGSAAARGDLLSGGNLKALQSRSQDLASQEYGASWNRASQQAQLREQWGQAESQMGWSQAQAEAAFREQQAQLASQQGWSQALQGQQNQYTQGLDTLKYNQGQQQQFTDEIYKRMLAQNELLYGRDVAQNETDYTRQQAAYKQQLAQHLLPWEQQSTLASMGGQAVGMYGQQGQGATSAIANLLTQQGQAQAGGATNQANSWLNALQNIGSSVQGGLQNNALLSALANLNR